MTPADKHREMMHAATCLRGFLGLLEIALGRDPCWVEWARERAYVRKHPDEVLSDRPRPWKSN